jgi:hypothetical protein
LFVVFLCSFNSSRFVSISIFLATVCLMYSWSVVSNWFIVVCASNASVLIQLLCCGVDWILVPCLGVVFLRLWTWCYLDSLLVYKRCWLYVVCLFFVRFSVYVIFSWFCCIYVSLYFLLCYDASCDYVPDVSPFICVQDM